MRASLVPLRVVTSLALSQIGLHNALPPRRSRFARSGSATAWLPTIAAAAPPLANTTTHLADEFRMSTQRVTVGGRLLCNGQPSSQSTVQLVNKNIGFDNIVKGAPAADGAFQLILEVERNDTMSPNIHIYTSCAAPAHCNRLIKFPVPQRYVNSTAYDKGTVNLEAKQDNEETVC